MKKILTMLLAVLSLACLVGGLVACGDSGKTEYTVAVYSVGGDKLRGVSVGFYNDDLDRVANGVTDKTGTVTARLEPAEYTVRLSDIPEGYNLPTEVYKTDTKGTTVEIRLISSIITDKTLPAGYVYTEGDVMYDYTVTTIDGETTTFSELLDDYNMIFINLWATTCGPCVSEFPYMIDAYHSAYPSEENPDRTYADEVALVLISSWESDNIPEVQNFKNTYYSDEDKALWSFDPSYCMHFSTGLSVPASIVIDRYGVFSYLHGGSMLAVSDFTRLFDQYCSPNYSQSISRPDDGDETVERPVNPYDMPSSKDIANAINGEGFEGTYHGELDSKDKEYSWPWFVGKEDDGTTYIYNSNQGIQSYSFATVYLNYHAKKDQVLAFDYYADVESGYDIFYVLFDGKQQFSTLTGKTDGWKTCYLDVAREEGDYEVVFLYNSDLRNPDNSLIEDIIKIKNVRLTDEKEMEANGVYLDILFDCTSGFDEDNLTWNNYVQAGLNNNDGFYHLLDEAGQPNGALVYLSTMMGTHWSNTSLYEYAAYSKLKFENANYNDFITNYCFFASCSDYESYIPVTKELKEALDDIAFQLGSAKGDESKRNNNEWLEMCVYILRYGAGEAPTNPIAGMTHFTAYDLHITDKIYTDDTYTSGISNGDLNKIEIRKQPLPRGTYFKFTPDTDGIYEFRSFGEYATLCWIIDGDEVNSYINKGDTESLNGESFNERNFTEYVNLYAGKTYYVLLDLYDQMDPTVFEKDNPGVLGTYYLSIRNVGNSHTVLMNTAVPNTYTTDDAADGEIRGNIIVITLGQFGTSGGAPYMSYQGTRSKIFVDLLTPNSLTSDFKNYANGRMVSLENVFAPETGKEIYVPTYDVNGHLVLDDHEEVIWIDLLAQFSEAEVAYMREKIAEAKTNAGTAENKEPPHGMVEVDGTMYVILEKLAHICSDFRASASNNDTPNYVANEWLQICYYYRTYTFTPRA